MSKKFIITAVLLIIIVAGLAYISLSPNTRSKSKITTQIEDNQNRTNDQNQQPLPPPKKTIGKVAPPPPPLPRKNRGTVTRPDNYKNFLVKERSAPIHKLTTGETKLLKLDIVKGSEDYTVKWFRKDEKKMITVGSGKEFNVTALGETQYYVAEVNDNIDRPQQLFFEVSGSDDTKKDTSNTQLTADEKVEPETIKKPETDTAAITNNEPETSPKVEPEDNQEKSAPVSEETNDELITALKNTDITVKAGTPLKISYKINSTEKYKISWFHRPLGKKKGAFIKGKKGFVFSLKKLNKYHQGEFYIQIKDSQGKMTKSPEYKVRLK